MNRIYSHENGEAYVIIATHIIHFSRSRRDSVVRVVPDKACPGAYLGSDGYRYQVGDTVILKHHPLTKDREFFDADESQTIPSLWLRTMNGIPIILSSRGSVMPHLRPSELFPEDIIEDYVADVYISSSLRAGGITREWKMHIQTHCGYYYDVAEIVDG